jgi:hypothetical protein
MMPILGTEAIATGALTRSALRWNYTALHPNVYLPKESRRDLYINTVAAWLWTGRKGIVAGRAAAALHGVQCIEDTAQVEIIAKHGRRQPGIVVREERVGEDEVCKIADLPVTSTPRTALDLARRLHRDDAVAHLDALAAATGLTATDVWQLEERYRGARGMPAARVAIGLMDGGARSRRETALRLLLIDAGLPRPRTNIEVGDEIWSAAIAMGWDGPMVGIDCEEDGPIDGYRAVQHIEREELFHRLGWFHIRVRAQHATRSIVHRARSALRQRGWR